MTRVRTVVSALTLALGVLMIVGWTVSAKAVEMIEDGESAAQLTDKALASPAVADLAADKIQEQIYTQLRAQVNVGWFDVAWGVAEQPLHQAIVSLIGSDFVATTAHTGAGNAQVGLMSALTDEEREDGALVLTVDVSPRINARLNQIPGIGTFLPDVVIDPVEVEVIAADTFAEVRDAYRVATWISTWLGWIGVALIVMGVATSSRRTWFVSRSMLITGVALVATGLAVGAVGASTVAGLMPGGLDSGAGAAVEELLADTALPSLAGRLLVIGAVALVISLVATLVARDTSAPSSEQGAVVLLVTSPRPR